MQALKILLVLIVVLSFQIVSPAWANHEAPGQKPYENNSPYKRVLSGRAFLSCDIAGPAMFNEPGNARRPFYNYGEVLAKLAEVATTYPDLVQAFDQSGNPLSMGTSHRGRQLLYVRLSALPEGQAESAVFINGMIHGREPGSMMQSLYLLCDWAEKYGLDKEVTDLLNTREIYFAPVLNPDALEINASSVENHERGWRRNSPIESAPVDLNRNFDYHFGGNSSSACPDDLPPQICEVYPGEEAFSEPETQAYRDFCDSHAFDLVLNLHSYGRMLVEPDGDAMNVYTNQEFTQVSRTFSINSGYRDDVLNNLLDMTVVGGANSWVLHGAEHYGLAFSPEVGAPKYDVPLGSSPSYDEFLAGFYPTFDEILATGDNLRQAFLQMALSSGPSIELVDLAWDCQGPGADPGEIVGLYLKFLSRGTQQYPGASVRVESLSPWVSVVPGYDQTNLPALWSGEEAIVAGDDIRLNIHLDAPVGHEAIIQVTCSESGNDRIFEFSLRLGTPHFWIDDDAETENSNWDYSGSWNRTDLDGAHEGNFLYSDSPQGNYLPSSDSALTLGQSLNLTDWDNLYLSHAVKWDIWYKTDFGSLESSVNNGQTWSGHRSQFSNLGYGNGVQQGCEFGYYGSSQGWVSNTEDLSHLAHSNEALIRYRLQSASSEYSESLAGLRLDDIKLYSYPSSVDQQITWSGNIILDRDVVIPANQTLVVNAGCNIEVRGNDQFNQGQNTDLVEIIVLGRILLEGTAENPISLTGAEVGGISWAGISVNSENGQKSDFIYTSISEALIALHVEGNSAIEISHCTLTSNETGIQMVGRGRDSVHHCKISEAQVGINLVNSSTRLEENHLYNNNCAISCTSSHPKVRHCTINANGVGVRTLDSWARPDLGSLNNAGNNDFAGDLHPNGLNMALLDPQHDIQAIGNWWGTTEIKLIRRSILVYISEFPDSRVNVYPFLNYGMDLDIAPVNLPVSGGLKAKLESETINQTQLSFMAPLELADGSIQLAFELPEPGRVEIDVYDLAGRCIGTLQDGYMNSGRNSVVWNGQTGSGSRAGSGMYLVRMKAQNKTAVTKCRLVR